MSEDRQVFDHVLLGGSLETNSLESRVIVGVAHGETSDLILMLILLEVLVNEYLVLV